MHLTHQQNNDLQQLVRSNGQEKFIRGEQFTRKPILNALELHKITRRQKKNKKTMSVILTNDEEL